MSIDSKNLITLGYLSDTANTVMYAPGVSITGTIKHFELMNTHSGAVEITLKRYRDGDYQPIGCIPGYSLPVDNKLILGVYYTFEGAEGDELRCSASVADVVTIEASGWEESLSAGGSVADTYATIKTDGGSALNDAAPVLDFNTAHFGVAESPDNTFTLTGKWAPIMLTELTEETSPASGDFLVFYDTTVSALRKLPYDNLPGAGTVDTSGTPIANDIARFTDGDTIEGRSYAELRADLSLEIGTDVLAEQTIGIADNNLVEIDHAAVADNDYARFTANGLEGRSYAEVRTDLGLVIGTDVLAEQTVGIADDNLVEMDDADAADNDFARFTANGLEGRSYAEVRSDLNVEDGADVTDTTNVTAAGALMDSEVDADIQTLTLPANTTISTFGASLIDDAAASNARSTLDVDQAGTDNSTGVTLDGTPNYITIAGQVITRGLIDLTTDVTGDLPVAEGGTGSSTASAARTALGLAIGTNVLAEQTVGIADDNLLEVDDADAADNDYAKFTANGLEGREYSEVRTDLGLVIGTNVLAEQTIGIADDNLLEVDDADAADDDYAKFTANGLEGRSYAELLGDIGVTAGADVTGDNTCDTPGGAGTDTTAIHDNVAAEYSFDEKESPHNDDVVMIEDSEDSNAKKKVKFTNFPTGSGMSSFTLTADSGSNQTIADGNTVDIAGGTGIATVVGATDTVTVNWSHLGLESLVDPDADRIAFWDDSASAFAWLVASTGITIDTTNITTNDSEIVHDDLSGFEANEHLDWTASVGTIHADNYTDTQPRTQAQIEDWAGGLFTGNTETFITATYQTGDNTLDLVVPVLDEDDMSTDSATHLATQQSIKKYVDDNASQLTQEEVEDYAGALVANATGTHTGITITYQDTEGDIDFVVDHDAASNFTQDEHFLQSAITTVGTIGTGVWQGTDIGTAYGGTGASNLDAFVLADGSNALAGAWDMGSQALTNVNIDSGVITGITDLLVVDGGTGAGTFTDHGVLVGSGTDPFTALAVGTDNQYLQGNSAADPAFAALDISHDTTPQLGGSLDLNEQAVEFDFASLTSDHTYSGITITGVAAENLVFSDVCYLNSDGEFAKMDSDALATTKGMCVMAVATINADASGLFLVKGLVRDDTWTWATVGAELYASETAGGMVDDLGTPDEDDVIRILGHVKHADYAWFDPEKTCIVYAA